jgi:type IV secretory pathway TrbL component
MIAIWVSANWFNLSNFVLHNYQLMNWAMSKNKKNNEFSIFVVVLLFVGKYVYDMNINHNFETITEGSI